MPSGNSGPGPGRRLPGVAGGGGRRDCPFKLPDYGHTITPVQLACHEGAMGGTRPELPESLLVDGRRLTLEAALAAWCHRFH